MIFNTDTMQNNISTEPSESSNITLVISDLVDMTVLELLILEFLIRYGAPIQRHTLYMQISNFLEYQFKRAQEVNENNLTKEELKYYEFIKGRWYNQKFISTSSFYNNLKKLEEKGLLRYNLGENDKVETIETTHLTRAAIDLYLKHFITYRIGTDPEIIIEIKDLVLKKMNKQSFQNMLIIWFPAFLDIRLLGFFSQQSDTVFLLSDLDFSKDIEEVGLNDIEITSIFGENIREPNEIFDLVVIPFYFHKNIDTLTHLDFIKEAIRVAKNDGYVILVMDEEIEPPEHSVLRRLTELFNRANSSTNFTMEEIEDDLSQVGLKKTEYEIFDYKEQIIVIIPKS